jgi:methyltransferase (TIGR00027 family)
MARALAHGRSSEPRFSDPTALALLPPVERERVERQRAGVPPRTLRDRWGRRFLDAQSKMMIARTVAIDEAIREARAPQVVILGAGLDGRSWRMPELAGAVVFEVDHPESQRMKRERIGALAQAAKDVRFVAVDFARDDLSAALAAAGHDVDRPTTWVWEGVVMYLSPGEVEATLAAVAARSAAGSRLVILYARPALLTAVVGLALRVLGEPHRSAQTERAMRSLLEKHGFTVVRDEGIPELGASMPADIARDTRVMRHLRVVTADQRSDA